jgi:hypothetical protein
MTTLETTPDHQPARHTIEVADQTLAFRPVHIEHVAPTGTQIAEAAGFGPEQQATVLHFLPDGELEDIRPTQTVDLTSGDRRFVVVETDRIYLLTINGERFEWPSRLISGAVVRRLGKVSPEDKLFLDRPGEPDRPVDACELVDLGKPGIEAFVSRKPTWKLNVQGVILTLHQPTIVVRQAIKDAGINPDQGWQIFLLVKGHPKKAVTLTDTVDLRTPGIEKLRLTPSGVNNGEAVTQPKRDFALLDVDEAYLNSLGYHWETVTEGAARWLLINNYQIPVGYTSRSVVLALLVPLTYPTAQIDMFYTYPALKLASGRPIAATQPTANIRKLGFGGWSRHRAWNPAVDNVITQLALVESAIAREIGE